MTSNSTIEVTMNTILNEALKLNVSERLQLVQDIWDSIASFPEAVELTEAQRQELDKRLQAYHANPNSGISWEELKARLLGS
jgi:putative addiction module component (TIGR02574 family)